MKTKNVVVGLAVAVSAVASSGVAYAQIGGSPAQGDYTSGSATGEYGKDDYYSTGKQASKISRYDTQNYVSPNTANPGASEHSANQTPQVMPMMQAGPGGLNQAATALMAPGSADMTPFPSGSFNYGFKNAPIQPYRGAYPITGGSRNAQYGGMLPNVSLGSVDFNTVDTSGIAPVGMGSPARGMGAPIGAPIVTMPNQSSSTQSTLNWLQNTFFGP